MTLRNLIPSSKKAVPVKHDGYSPFSLLRRDMDELFYNIFQGFDLEPSLGRRNEVFSPNVDVKENEKEVKVYAELPGMDDKDIEVTLGKDSLTIKGEKKEEKEEKRKDYYHVERSYGSFSRTIPLPAEVVTDKAKASFKKGVLTVNIPKTVKAIKEKKKINVRVE
jgi:HSP20 family protein